MIKSYENHYQNAGGNYSKTLIFAMVCSAQTKRSESLSERFTRFAVIGPAGILDIELLPILLRRVATERQSWIWIFSLRSWCWAIVRQTHRLEDGRCCWRFMGWWIVGGSTFPFWRTKPMWPAEQSTCWLVNYCILLQDIAGGCRTYIPIVFVGGCQRWSSISDGNSDQVLRRNAAMP